MKTLNPIEILLVTGGEIIPGSPSPGMCCLNVKLMVITAQDEPGFDVGVAAFALNKYCIYLDEAAALDYARNGAQGFNYFTDFIFSVAYFIFN